MGKTLAANETVKKILNRMYNYFQDIELLTLRIVGFIPIYLVRYIFYILAGVKIGKGSHIHMGTQFFDPTGVEIGKGSIVGQNAFLDGRDKLVIGDFVDIASDVMIYNSEHDINSEDFRPVVAPVIIENYVFIGPRAIILPGVTIKKGAVVGAGAVVTKEVPEFVIVGGVPAKVIGERALKDLNYKLGRSRLFQ
ncbi:acyltransferase [Candidatus Daviesbacteria bacterium]|nr:acyltransferase [Candidatus Daviesbacteria bacterium]